MNIKIHESYRAVVAICDNEILGKKFEEGKRQLDLKESFYKDKEVEEDELIRIIQYHSNEDSTFNIVGEKSINAAIKAGIISEENVDYIQQIPFTLVLV